MEITEKKITPRKILKWVRHNILETTVLIIIAFALSAIVLSALHLRFRFFMYQGIVIFSVLGIVIGIIQKVRRNENKKVQIAI
ncbi:MAG: hypothetical protein K6G06_06125, partial [Butyrivibrio sp.]|nr:hypothetical protein [Butyrivibrio sp.]